MAGVKSVVLFCSAFLLVVAGVSARAEVIVDNIDGVRSFYATREPLISLGYETSGELFTLGEGLSYRLTSVTVPLTFDGGAENTMTVSIWGSRRMGPAAIQPGLPGPSDMLAIIGSRTFSGNTAFESYETFAGFGDVTLSPGAYWLMVQQTPGMNSIDWDRVNRHTSYVTYRETGTGGLAYFAHGDPTSEKTWSVSSTGASVALMAIEGTPVTSAPEPSTIVLGLFGVGTIVARRMARSRSN